MRTNIKTYRYLANVFANHMVAYKAGNMSEKAIVYSFFTKLRFSDNVHKVSNLLNEIQRLIGIVDMLTIWDLYDNTSDANSFIQEHIALVNNYHLTRQEKSV